MTKPARRGKPVKAWAGFVEGRLDSWRACDEYDFASEDHREFAIFRSYKDARKRYEDVRRVTITVENPK